MNGILKAYLNNVEFGEMKVFGGMGVLPVFRKEYDALDHLTMKEALDHGSLVISEVSHAGSVPELKAINKGSLSVLILDGEELAGAKQNRVLNTTILILGKSEVVVPVSCTEHGRWVHQSDHFSDSGIIMASFLRSEKNRSVSESLNSSRSYRSDQAMVWNGIEEMHRTGRTSSRTGAMRDAYEQKSAEISEYVEAFPCHESQCGMLAFIRGHVAGLDIIPCLPAYHSLHRKLLTSYAMETQIRGQGGDRQPSSEQGVAFLKKISSSSESKFPSVGEGDDYRYAGPNIIGTALVAVERVVHLAFFPTKSVESGERISSASRRRYYREHIN